jgi:hypothetical protein
MSTQTSSETCLPWFGGNQDAANLYLMLIELSHTWDDIVDQDNGVVDENRVNQAFMTALVYMPNNPFYQRVITAMPFMWSMIVSAYETANEFERKKEVHGVEIAHSLRYATGHVVAQMIMMCVSRDEARMFIPEMWKNVFFDRYDEYYREHTNNETQP